MITIAYTYEADVHCTDCAMARFAHTSANGAYVEHNHHPMMPKSFGKPGAFTSYDRNGVGTALDVHLIPENATDNEGNPIHPVFSTDEHDFTHCGDCHVPI